MLGAVRPVGFVVLVTLSLFASASWAQQKPSAVAKPPSEAGTCTVAQLALCKGREQEKCAPTNQTCLNNAITSCNTQCGLP